jgi:hypothetical protein
MLRAASASDPRDSAQDENRVLLLKTGLQKKTEKNSEFPLQLVPIAVSLGQTRATETRKRKPETKR